jgi:hypothetical protein
MKSILPAILATAATLLPSTAFTGTGTLNLTTGANDNKLQITISVNYNGFPVSDAEITTVSGTLNVTMDSNPQTGATSVFTINGGNVAMTNMAFNLKAFGFIPVATINTAGMKGTAFTAVPPGVAIPTATGGTFAAAQHHVLINQGTITGNALGTPIDANFASSPVEGPGAGSGTLAVVPGSSNSTYRNCGVTMVLPVDFTDTQDLDGTAVTVKVSGSIKATGTIPIPLNSWVDWTIGNDLTGADFTAPTAPGAAPLGLAWAMGYAPDTPATMVTPVMAGGAVPAASFLLPASGSRAPLILEQSDSLTAGSWQTVSATAVSGGQNPVPVGRSGTMTVQWASPAATRLLRIKAIQP